MLKRRASGHALRKAGRQCHLALEQLEHRRMLAVGCTVNTDYCVMTNNDSGAGSLREAISVAVGTAGNPFQIDFQIPGPGPHSILVASRLPDIATPVSIDGSSQPGFSGTPVIELSGADAGDSDGLRIRNATGTVEIRGLAINGFQRSGIYVNSASLTGNRIVGNFIGVNLAGTEARGNRDGIYLQDSAYNIIGGSNLGEQNLISGNTDDGIDIRGVGSHDNEILGNLIGTDFGGVAAIGNLSDGVQIIDAPMNRIGGTNNGARNLISGNESDGIDIRGATAQQNIIQGNFIGTDINGTMAIPNTADGILLADGPKANTIGGSAEGAGNLIAGNGSDGIDIRGTDTLQNAIQGNFIGTDITGTFSVPNTWDGVHIGGGATDNTVGGSAAGAGNLIAGNGNDGIELRDLGTSNNVVLGNLIGTDVAGTAVIPNAWQGVRIAAGASNNRVGGSESGAGNVISGNGRDGVHLTDGAFGNILQQNRIGTNTSGETVIGNARFGIYVLDNARGNTIGGTAENSGNRVAHNHIAGIVLGVDAGEENSIRGNSIYLNPGIGIALEQAVAIEHDGSLRVTRGRHPNDDRDIDEGPNRLQNYPTLESAVNDAPATTVSGTLNSRPNELFSIDFYANPSAPGPGDMEQYIGSAIVATDAQGNASFAALLPVAIELGTPVAATATDAFGNTSEVSGMVRATDVNGSPFVYVSDTGTLEGDSAPNNVVFTLSLSHAHDQPVSLQYETTDVTAIAGQDYLATAGTATFEIGETQKQVIIQVIGDTVNENTWTVSDGNAPGVAANTEIFHLSIVGASNAVIIDATGTGRIMDDDHPGQSKPFGAAADDTSEYMLGNIYVTIVLLESNGLHSTDQERWTTAQIEDVKQRATEGLEWWEDVYTKYTGADDLDFIIDFSYADSPISSDYEPVLLPTRDSDQESLWMSTFLKAVGFDTPADHRQDLRLFNDHQRAESNADWAFTMFVVNRAADEDSGFSDRNALYARLGGPYATAFDVGGFSHETGHVFYALDEYCGGGDYGSTAGYYNAQNLNACDGRPVQAGEQELSIMKGSFDTDPDTGLSAYESLAISTAGRSMLGWRDSDADGIMDVLDVPLILSGEGSFDPVSSAYRFVGQSTVQTHPNMNPRGSGNDITLNLITHVQYRVNGGSWENAADYYTPEASIDIAVNASPGDQVELRTIDARRLNLDGEIGVVSNVFTEVAEGIGVRLGERTVVVSLPIEVDPTVLNLYDGLDESVDLPDVTLRGTSQGAIEGSLLWNADDQILTFVKSDGPFAPDTYTLVLEGRPLGVVDLTGSPLDGDFDGQPGGNFSYEFDVNASDDRIMSLSDFVRGAGQPVELFGTSGIPIWIDNAAGVTKVDFTLRYDSNLLDIAGIIAGSAIPPGWITEPLEYVEPGLVRIAMGGATPLGAGKANLGVLIADVPEQANGDSQVLEFESISLNDGAVGVRGSEAIQVVGLFGDPTSDGTYSGLDASLIARVAVGLDSGFDALDRFHPMLFGDVTGDGTLSALDAAFVARKAVGLPQPEIPDRPLVGNPPPNQQIGIEETVVVDTSADLPTIGWIIAIPSKLSSVEPRWMHESDEALRMAERVPDQTWTSEEVFASTSFRDSFVGFDGGESSPDQKQDWDERAVDHVFQLLDGQLPD